MPQGTPRARMPKALLLAAMVCACAPGAAWGAASPPTDGDLSARLAELAEPAVRTAPPAQQAKALSVAQDGPGSLVREGNRVLVEVRFERGAATRADELRRAGAKVIDVSARYQTVTVAAKPSELRALSTVPGVVDAREVLAPIVHAAADSGPVSSAVAACFGGATSEGDQQLRADIARAEFEVDGDGVQVGVLSDSFNQDASAPRRQPEDVASGDLPGPGNPCGQTTPVTILDDLNSPDASDEGRAMAQIVHDLAPGAPLAFATAFKGLTSFANNIRSLRDNGAGVIVDDVSYFIEPFFQEGPISVAVSDVAASGVNYFSSAGNNNLISAGKNIASWEAPEFRDSGACPASLETLSSEIETEFGAGTGLNPSHCIDFDPEAGVDRTFGITVSKNATLSLDLQWAEPWEGVSTDIDAFLFDSEGNPLAMSIEDNPSAGGTQRPFEFLSWENDSGSAAQVQLVINRYSGEDPRIKLALLQNGGGVSATEYPESAGGDVVGPTIFGHNGAADGVSTGAIRYNASLAPEPFSSRGPVTHYFGPVKSTTPAAPLGSPTVLAKPDLVATDGGANTFFGSCVAEVWRFFGTSAAAPHAAAIAALEREAEPGAAAAEVTEGQLEGASPVGTFGPETVGAGLLDAVAAIESLGVTPSAPGEAPPSPPSPLPCEPTASEEPTLPEDEIAKIEEQVIDANPASPTETATQDFRDRTAPRTWFRRTPPKVVRSRRRRARVVFVFRSNERNVDFLCQFDRKRYRRCGARFVRFFLHGRHVLRVRARDAAGNVDPTPAVYRFRVKRGKPTRGARGSG